MKLINWVELHLNHINLIFPFLGGIFEFITTAILYQFDEDFQLNHHPFISGINAGIGMSLVMVPYYFIKTHARKRDILILGRKYKELSHKRNQPKVRRQRYLIFFLCAFLDSIKKVLEFTFCKIPILNHIWIYNILFISGFNYMLNKNKLYKHQYFSIGVILLLGTILNIILMHSMSVDQIPLLLLAILVEAIYSLLVVLGKFGLDNRYCSPFVLTFCEGSLSLIFNIVFLIIASVVPLSAHFKYTNLLYSCEYKGKKYLDNFNAYTEKLNHNFNELLFFFVTMTGKTVFSLFTHITTRYYTSSHVMIILILGRISIIMKPMEIYQRVMASIIYFFEFVMIFIFCELVELKCFGLQQNIKRNIEEKQREELFNKDEEHAEQDMWDGLELNSDSASSDHNVSFEIA